MYQQIVSSKVKKMAKTREEGNPDNPNGLRMAYHWEEILQKDSLKVCIY